MQKKIFIMSKVYDMALKTVFQIEEEVQTDLNEYFDGGIRFKIKVISEKTLELVFFRKYKDYDWLNHDPKTIYNIDANIITGHAFKGFRMPVFWENVPYGYSFNFPKRDFIRCYKESAVKLGGDMLGKIKVLVSEQKITMRLGF